MQHCASQRSATCKPWNGFTPDAPYTPSSRHRRLSKIVHQRCKDEPRVYCSRRVQGCKEEDATPHLHTISLWFILEADTLLCCKCIKDCTSFSFFPIFDWINLRCKKTPGSSLHLWCTIFDNLRCLEEDAQHSLS